MYFQFDLPYSLLPQSFCSKAVCDCLLNQLMHKYPVLTLLHPITLSLDTSPLKNRNTAELGYSW